MSLNTNISKSFPFGVGGLINKPRIKMLAGVLRPDGNATPAGTITWSFLTSSSNHNKIGKITVEANGTALRLKFPKCKNAILGTVHTDEVLANNGITAGASVGLQTADISLFQSKGVYGGLLVGSGSSWTKSGDLASFTFGTLDADQLYFRPPKPFSNSGSDIQNSNYWQSCIANFVGSNTRKLVRITSGLGSDYFGYQLLDSSDVPVVTNDTNDIIEILTNTPKRVVVNANSNDSSGFPGANLLITTSNIWVQILLEY